MKFNETGRSMIEMLGVLAIVGILSVGGIAGYSKAMKKYKYNKLAEEFTLFIQDLFPYKEDFIKGKDYVDVVPYLENIAILPASWTIKPGKVIDSMGNSFTVTVRRTSNMGNILQFDYALSGRNKRELCVFFFANIITNSVDWILSTGMYQSNSEDNSHSSAGWVGNTLCNETRRCIRDMTMADMLEMCQFCDDKRNNCVLMLKY